MQSSVLPLLLTVLTSADIILNISSDSIVSLNGHNTTSQYLMGLTYHGSGEAQFHNDSLLKQMNEQFGVNVIGSGQSLMGLLPTNQQEAIKCCNTTQELREWINSGEACNTLKQTEYQQVFHSDFYRDETTMITFNYLNGVPCNNNSLPEFYHCIGNDSGNISFIYIYIT